MTKVGEQGACNLTFERKVVAGWPLSARRLSYKELGTFHHAPFEDI